MKSCFQLKLLNGPLRGQELKLPIGMFTLGDGESDLRLPLDMGGQASLEVTVSDVSLASPTQCWVDGRQQGTGALPLNKGIDLDGIHFVLAAADEELQTPLIKKRNTGSKLPIGVLIASLILAIVMVGVLCSQPPSEPVQPREWVPQMLVSEPGVEVHWLEDNSLMLSGRCTDSNKLMTLTERLRTFGVRLHLEAICNDDLKHSVEALLSNYGFPNVTVMLDNQGNALIDGGFHGDTSAMEQALDHLPGLIGWSLSDSGSQELALLITHLQNAKLLEGLSAKRAENGWVISGKLDSKQQVQLAALLEQLNQVAGDHLPMRFIGAASSIVDKTYLPAPIAGVGGNAKTPYVQLANGMRLLIGTSVGYGMRVIAITPTGISLAGNQSLVFIPL